jgi:hypothetical protein
MRNVKAGEAWARICKSLSRKVGRNSSKLEARVEVCQEVMVAVWKESQPREDRG